MNLFIYSQIIKKNPIVSIFYLNLFFIQRCVCVTERVKNNRESSEEINRRLEGGILRFDQGESKDIDEYLKRSRLLLSTA